MPKSLYLANALGVRANSMDILKYLIIQSHIHTSRTKLPRGSPDAGLVSAQL